MLSVKCLRLTWFFLIGAACSLWSAAAQAETLVLEFSAHITSDQITIPQQFADLKKAFDSHPENGDLRAKVIIPNYEAYATGTHVIELNVGNGLNYGPDAELPAKIKTPGLSLTLESKLLGPLEGVRKRGEGGAVILPDETQLADYGSVTVMNGKVTEFRYGWVEPTNAGLKSVNDFLVKRRKFLAGMKSLKIDIATFSTPVTIGDLALVQGLNPSVHVEVMPAPQE